MPLRARRLVTPIGRVGEVAKKGFAGLDIALHEGVDTFAQQLLAECRVTLKAHQEILDA